MNREDMVDQLRKGICTVKFTKVNGEERLMSCTLSNQFIPENLQPSKDSDDTGVQRTLDVIRVFDVNADGWRSFRVENVLAFNE